MNIRTDLAFEAHDFYTEASKEEIDGVDYREEEKNGIKLKRVSITKDDAAKTLNKSKGDYVTVHVDNIEYQNDYEIIAQILADELKKMISVKDDDVVLVVGLGNRDITADALGPKVVSGLVISRHLKSQLPDIAADLGCVCAISPGVLGITGIETGEIIKGVCEKISPSYIIAVDALAAANIERIVNTIQISNTGIVPGSGVNNHRNALTEKTLGIPVIAIGVPTVVTIGTIVYETLSLLNKQNVGFDKTEEYLKQHSQMVVTPKNIDVIMSKVSKMISAAINISLHPKLSLSELENFL